MANIHEPNHHVIELDQVHWDRLLLALGTTLGAARHGLSVLTTNQVLDLCNYVNRDNPRFCAYTLFPEEKP